MSTYIWGNVARIVSETEIVVTLDAPEKARVGMEFDVIEEGDAIRDAEGKVLGKLELQKARVRLIHVQPEFAFAESGEVTRIWLGPEPDYEEYLAEQDLEQELWRIRPKPIAEKPTTEVAEEGEGGEKAVLEQVSLRQLMRAKLKNRLVVVGDLLRSTVPVG